MLIPIMFFVCCIVCATKPTELDRSEERALSQGLKQSRLQLFKSLSPGINHPISFPKLEEDEEKSMEGLINSTILYHTAINKILSHVF